MGHNKSSCKKAKKVGTQLTPSNWSNLEILLCVSVTSNESTVEMIDTLFPKSKMRLHILGQSEVGSIYNLHILCCTSRFKVLEDSMLWLQEDDITVWAAKGKK